MSTNPHEDRAFLCQPDNAYLTKAQILQWEEGKTFSTDWAANHFFEWARLLHGLREKKLRILEIGSWEGRSATFFLNYLPQSTIVCIDPFEGSEEHHADPYFADLARKSEQQFDANLASFGARVEKRKGFSSEALPQLAIERRRFDLAYIDGSHRATDVFRDAVLVWPLVETDGVIIFDDYEWGLMEVDADRPKLGVDRFLEIVRPNHRELHRAYQVAIQKVAVPDPARVLKRRRWL